MYEDRPEKDTPEHIQTELRDYGGLSPDGQPIWRLVLAQNRKILCFGTMNHISINTSKLPEFSRPTDVEPDRIEEGRFWVPRYDAKKVVGWILERWFPPHIWGTRNQWDGEKARDGRTRLLAAYPQRGDYMMMPAGPWKSISQVGDLKAAIRCYNAQQRRNPVNWGHYLQALSLWEEQERQQRADEYYEELCAAHREVVANTLRTASESAQAFRNVVAEASAGGVNLGASEKWG